MKKYIFILLLLCVQFSWGQISLGASFSPEIGYRTLGYGEEPRIKDYRDKHEIPAFGNTSGINVLCVFSEKLALETGLLYTNKNHISESDFRFYDPNDPTISNSGIETKYYHHAIQLPLLTNIYLVKKESFSFLLACGVTQNFLIAVTSKNKTFDTKEKYDNDQFNRYIIGVKGGFGIDIYSKKNTLRIAPMFEYWVTSLTNTSQEEYIYSGGLALTYYFDLKQ